MPPKGSGRGKSSGSVRGRGRGRGANKMQKIETEEERLAREEKELIETKKMQLIEYIKEHPIIFDIGHPDHLNSTVTKVIWEDMARKLNEEGNHLKCFNVQQ